MMPELAGSLLFLEDDGAADADEFARSLASLLQMPGAEKIRGLAIGRFQLESKITRSLLEQVLAKHPRLSSVPVVANLDFGHTSPMFTLPIGGWATLDTDNGSVRLDFAHHPDGLAD